MKKIYIILMCIAILLMGVLLPLAINHHVERKNSETDKVQNSSTQFTVEKETESNTYSEKETVSDGSSEKEDLPDGTADKTTEVTNADGTSDSEGKNNQISESEMATEKQEITEGLSTNISTEESTTESDSESTAYPEAEDFVLVSDVIPDVVEEIRYYTDYNFVGERIDGYEEPVALLTKEAASALKEVSDELSTQGYRLKIYDAYRPQQAVDNFVSWAEDVNDTKMKADFYPDIDKSLLFDQGYIGRHSGHSRGSTVDLTLVEKDTLKEVDMGGTFDYFGEISHPYYTGVTDEQYDHRMLLRNAMISHGFRPLDTEWWHFTLENEPYPDTYFTFPVNSKSVGE